MSMYENVGLTSLDYIEEILHLRKALADVSDECSKAYDKIANFEQQRWVSVKDRLPVEIINPLTQDFEPVICATTFGDVRVYGYGKAKGHDKAHFWHGAGIMDKYVTHWMPLPQPPKENNYVDDKC